MKSRIEAGRLLISIATDGVPSNLEMSSAVQELTDDSLLDWSTRKITPAGEIKAQELIDYIKPYVDGVPLSKRHRTFEDRVFDSGLPVQIGRIRNFEFFAITFRRKKADADDGRLSVASFVVGAPPENAPAVEAYDFETGVSVVKFWERIINVPRWTPLIPYAFQVTGFGGIELVCFRTEKGDFKVPVQAKYFDFAQKRVLVPPTWAMCKSLGPNYIVARTGSKRFSKINRVFAIIGSYGTEAERHGTWVPPRIEE
jgi:hypothetical protein